MTKNDTRCHAGTAVRAEARDEWFGVAVGAPAVDSRVMAPTLILASRQLYPSILSRDLPAARSSELTHG